MQKPPQEPSDLSRAFSWDRLKIIGQMAYDRAWWVAKHAIDKDDRCGIGYRRWCLIRADIMEAAGFKYPDWLSLPDRGAEFVFASDGVPIRFCKGDADADVPLPEKYAKPTRVEKAQLDLLTQAGNEAAHRYLYRLLIVPDSKGRYPVGVYFVAADIDTGVIKYVWNIPTEAANDLDGDSRSAAPIVAPKPPKIMPPLMIPAREEIEAEAHRMEQERQAKEQAARDAAQRDKTKGA